MSSIGETSQEADSLYDEMTEFEQASKSDFSKAESLHELGEEMMNNDHYAVDCIRPKCIELQRVCEQYRELVRKRYDVLMRSKDLQDRINKAHFWCKTGQDIVNDSQIASFQVGDIESIQSAIAKLEDFLPTSSELRLCNPKEFRQLFDEIITKETRMQVQELLKKIEEVQRNCEEHGAALQHHLEATKRITPPSLHKQKELDSISNTSSEGEISEKKTFKKSLSSSRLKHSISEDRGVRHIELVHSDALSLASDSSLDSGFDNVQNNHNNQSNLTTISAVESESLQTKRRHVMRELIETEKVYVEEIHSILQGYAAQFDNPSLMHLIPDQLHGRKDVLFGNLQEIYDFHSRVFSKDLENCKETPALVGKCFVSRHEEFKMYSIYCQNKPNSEQLRAAVGDNNRFFQECQRSLKHQLPLSSYLLKPVQRITKYQLLLKEMSKYTQNQTGHQELQHAMDAMQSVVKYVNDIMHQVAITGYQGDLSALGNLLNQASFQVWQGKKKEKIRDLRFKPMQRHIFLYENGILFCKHKEEQGMEKESYIFKNSIDTSQIGITPIVKDDKRKFELWTPGRGEVYTIQAPSVAVHDMWVRAINRVLMNQFSQLKNQAKKDIPTINVGSNPVTSVMTSAADDSISGNSITSSELNSTNNNDNAETDLSTSSSGLGSLQPGSEYNEGAGESGSDGEAESTPSETQSLEILDHYVAVAEYMPPEGSQGQLALSEGDLVRVVKLGTEGWWFVRRVSDSIHDSGQQEGWTPASFLEEAKRLSSISSVSMSSACKSAEEDV